ncbi:phenylacetaldoxime dehydratase family protein [Variovorax sp. UC122_21]|uniref:phenylacetaldoxime dehydratase family protein n=1 Tax=Variovorax sp. UC122_21 TaxID=3374554 RepID=UPI0037573B3B
MTEPSCPHATAAAAAAAERVPDARQASAREALPEDYPGRIVAFPEDVTHMVSAMYGFQSRTPGAADAQRQALQALFALPDGPGWVERAHYVDPQGHACDILLAYWVGRDAYLRWSASEAPARWWRELPADPAGGSGFWREVMSAHKDRFQYAAGTDEPASAAALLPMVGSKKFGYWGSYRDRFAASRGDNFASPHKEMPDAVARDTLGRRIRITTPDNICFIREGQGWERALEAERAIWTDKMEQVVAQWVAALQQDPKVTGGLSIRFCREQDVASGAEREKQSQFGFLLSLGHIEKAARTHATHLCVRSSFIDMYTEPKFAPQMHIWVEAQILKRDELDAQYINCHPHTGLLPYFEASEVPAGCAVRFAAD